MKSFALTILNRIIEMLELMALIFLLALVLAIFVEIKSSMKDACAVEFVPQIVQPMIQPLNVPEHKNIKQSFKLVKCEPVKLMYNKAVEESA